MWPVMCKAEVGRRSSYSHLPRLLLHLRTLPDSDEPTQNPQQIWRRDHRSGCWRSCICRLPMLHLKVGCAVPYSVIGWDPGQFAVHDSIRTRTGSSLRSSRVHYPCHAAARRLCSYHFRSGLHPPSMLEPEPPADGRSGEGFAFGPYHVTYRAGGPAYIWHEGRTRCSESEFWISLRFLC